MTMYALIRYSILRSTCLPARSVSERVCGAWEIPDIKIVNEIVHIPW